MNDDRYRIFTVGSAKDEKFLRKPVPEMDFGSGTKGTLGRKEMAELLRKMRKTMKAARGVGLSANQIGLPYRLFVAEVPNAQGEPKFYAVANPVLDKMSGRKLLEEGCLSVPGVYGNVERATEVSLRGLDRNGRPLRIKAWGLLAHVFQHEVDHLNGKLFTDKAKDLRKVPESERLSERKQAGL